MRNFWYTLVGHASQQYSLQQQKCRDANAWLCHSLVAYAGLDCYCSEKRANKTHSLCTVTIKAFHHAVSNTSTAIWMHQPSSGTMRVQNKLQSGCYCARSKAIRFLPKPPCWLCCSGTAQGKYSWESGLRNPGKC